MKSYSPLTQYLHNEIKWEIKIVDKKQPPIEPKNIERAILTVIPKQQYFKIS